MTEAAAYPPIAAWVADTFYWVFIAVLVVNLTQRRHQSKAEKKRFATLYLGLAVFVFFILAQMIVRFGGADWMLVPAAVLVLATVYALREHTFPFRLYSPVDGRRLTFQEILYDDNHGDAPPDTVEDTEDE